MNGMWFCLKSINCVTLLNTFSSHTMLRLFVGLLSIYAVVGYFLLGEKPGQCPVSDIATTCDCPTNQMACYNDFQCPFDQKCCSYGCGCRTSCESPVFVGPGSCFVDGMFYQVGQDVPSGDLCNGCSCQEDGNVVCTLIQC